MKKYIKGFDENLQCRGFQFEVGKEYEIELNGRELKLCTNTGFHFCDNLQNVHEFYNCNTNNRYCEIEVLGDMVGDGTKYISNHIKIVREIKGDELDNLKNSGANNSGLFNSGYYNSGNYNSGDYNSGDYNSGFFNTTEPTVRLFNVDTDLSFSEFICSKYYRALNSTPFTLTEWYEFTDEEKEESIIRQLIGGKLVKYTYKEACVKWWNKLTDENKEIIQEIPHFDKSIFFEITGIEL